MNTKNKTNEKKKETEMRVFPLFDLITTDQPTNQPTDGWTDGQSLS